MKTKIHPQEAWEIIQAHAHLLPVREALLTDALGLHASCDITAPIPLPPFDNSAVDGYALAKAAAIEEQFRIVATLGAGEVYHKALLESEACRIMTGAKIPSGVQTVVMQEHVCLDASMVTLNRAVAVNENIRRAGDDVRQGEIVLRQGACVTAAHVGLLCALGVEKLSVRKKPSIAIVSTGSELVDAGSPLQEGQVYYCTGPMLKALATSAGLQVHSVAKIADDKEAIVDALIEAQGADIIIMVGGMAQGLFDHGRYAFDKIGVQALFFEGLWQPGKPLFFGTWAEKLVFGLPGNPVAAFVMFKMFVEPAANKLAGGSGKIPWKNAKILGGSFKTTDKSRFLRARLQQGGLEILEGQGSHQLWSLSQADAIVWIPPNISAANIDEFQYLSLES